MNLEIFLAALVVAGLAFVLGYLVGRAPCRRAPLATNAVTQLQLRSGTVPITPPTRLPDLPDLGDPGDLGDLGDPE